MTSCNYSLITYRVKLYTVGALGEAFGPAVGVRLAKSRGQRSLVVPRCAPNYTGHTGLHFLRDGQWLKYFGGYVLNARGYVRVVLYTFVHKIIVA